MIRQRWTRLVDLGAKAVRVGRALFVDLEFSPVLPPWSHLRNDDSTVGSLRQMAVPLARDSLSGPFRAPLIVACGILWPVSATVQAGLFAIRHGGQIRQATGVTRSAQFASAMRLAHRMNYSPRSFHTYRFWDPSVRPTAHEFLQVQEMAVLQRHLNREDNVEDLNHKETFANRCEAIGIATPPLVVTISPGEPDRWRGKPNELPKRDLFFKPLWGERGAGAERWVHDSRTDRWSRRQAVLTHDELLIRCRRLARREPMLVQLCLENHPDLTRFSVGPLCTYRVMTYLDDHGTAHVLGLILKMPRGGSDVDNLHAGGLVASVDPVTGQLGPGITGTPTDNPRHHHPETGEVIEGATVSSYRDVVALARRAHEDLDMPWSVGWDVAMTPQGAVMVEGNPLWSVGLLHIASTVGLPIGFASQLSEKATAPSQKADEGAFAG